jgi:hypothetical protein
VAVGPPPTHSDVRGDCSRNEFHRTNNLMIMHTEALTVAQESGTAAWISAWAAVGTLTVLVVTAVYAIRQFGEAKELRRDQTRPYVVPSIGVEQQMMFMLFIENVGRTPAFNVVVDVDPQPQSEIKDLEAVSILRQPIPTMPPGHRFRAYWESSLTVFDEENPYKHPMKYKVTVNYSDSRGQKYGPEDYVLDFHVYEGQAIGPKGVTELVKAVEELTKSIRSGPMGHAVSMSGQRTLCAKLVERIGLTTSER